MDRLAEQLAASVAYVQEQKRQKSDLQEWLDAAPMPPKRLPRRKRMNEQTAAIVVHREVSAPLEFTPQQRAMIRDTYANGADEKEFQVLLEVAKLRRLNPLLRQIHFVKRWNKDLGRMVWSAQVSVDGLRAIAERTGKYDGQDEAEFGEMVNGFPEWARVKVYRKDWARPAVGTAYWSEYVQKTKEGGVTRFWREMPRVMLAKCAEAIAMRKAFPEDMGGLYVDEEMQQAENGSERLHLSPHAAPDEDTDAPAKESNEFSKMMADLNTCKLLVFDPGCTWETMVQTRAVFGTKAAPSPFSKRLSELYRGDELAPSQRKELAAIWNSVERKLTALEAKLKPPPVEASFVDPPDDDTAAFAPATQTGEDEEEV
jgi:phage recombination protein Bet